ncbi:MAG: nucleotide sugar dehydrogenase [Candidatus Vogelbacteria bacterium]|nr:nucleotide sugar dehydrogenase [Candidatus Vogelbacteria bacterium]
MLNDAKQALASGAVEAKKHNISIVGLGKLGACMVAAYASKGHKVIGIDIDQSAVDAINNGQSPVQETDLQKYISENRERISAESTYSRAINESEITFIIVPTPSTETGSFSVDYVKSACTEIGKVLKQKTGFHLVVVTSTVLPGDCENKIIPVLEESSGKKCGVDFGFCYNPEFIAIGSVIHDLLNPDLFLFGEFDKKSGDILEEFYSVSSNNGARSVRMSIPSAELAKISLNHFMTLKITFANMLAEVAQAIPGVNVDDVTEALGGDTRIGKKYLRGGLGYGGPCFPRDNRAFAAMAGLRGISVPFAQITDTYNKSIIDRMVKILAEKTGPEDTIGIVGLSYKPGTGLCEESQGLIVAKKLAELGRKVTVFEPSGHYHAKTLLGDAVSYCENLDALLDKADLVFLTNWDRNNLEIKDKVAGRKITIVDPWRQFPNGSFSAPAIYLPLGRN